MLFRSNKAKHITFIRKTGYTAKGAKAKTATITAKAPHSEREEVVVEVAIGSDMVYFWVPNRPAGLISNTMAMMTKITVLDASG